jgi:prepilin-type processing-associated H-X9-DG protein
MVFVYVDVLQRVPTTAEDVYNSPRLENRGCPAVWSEPGNRPEVVYKPVDEDLSAADRSTYLSVKRNRFGEYFTVIEDLLPPTYHRTREGVERFFITDINNPGSGAQGQSTIAVMWDAWGATSNEYEELGVKGERRFNHIPGGANALYMDGHVEFTRYNEGYPCTTNFEGEYNDYIAHVSQFAGGYG